MGAGNPGAGVRNRAGRCFGDETRELGLPPLKRFGRWNLSGLREAENQLGVRGPRLIGSGKLRCSAAAGFGGNPVQPFDESLHFAAGGSEAALDFIPGDKIGHGDGARNEGLRGLETAGEFLRRGLLFEGLLCDPLQVAGAAGGLPGENPCQHKAQYQGGGNRKEYFVANGHR